ncbi:MAG: lipase family protein [Gammaproteobacteria bacterium]|nr:lipase family protein [Gammaproteobacteria bacterium]
MKAVENRGRTLDGVVNPGKYEPFMGMVDRAAFDVAWEKNPDWILANMAHAAYCSEENIIKTMEKLGLNFECFYQSEFGGDGIKRGREAFLVSWDDKVILSFRGTEGADRFSFNANKMFSFFVKTFDIKLPKSVDVPFIPTDIFDDVNFSPVVYQDHGGAQGKSSVHGGFLKATKELWPKIKMDLQRLRNSGGKEFFVTGHSLGAAMAVVAAMMGDFNRVVTFGEPSVGNDLDNTINKHCQHIRYVNGDDPVTKIVPKFIFQPHGDKVEITEVSGADWRFDHSIINYAAILAPIVKS